MPIILYVALGGAIGAALRHLVNVWTLRAFGPGFPWGTLSVNVIGSFLMGALITYFALKWSATLEMRALLTTGILGGFTTFSAFSLDVVGLMERKQHLLAVAYASASVGFALIGLFAGMALIRSLLA